MAEGEEQVHCQEEEEDDDDATQPLGYKPPAQKSINEILNQDAEDESLRKYKQTLLGSTGGNTIIDESNPSKVILLKMALCVKDRPDKEINLQDVSQLKNMKFIVKEGASYQLRIDFQVQREIVSGLKFVNKVGKGPLKKKITHMAGSYGPDTKVCSWTTPAEEFPSGLTSRMVYNVKSCFIDDDNTKFLEWEWKFEIKKDWAD